MSRLTRLLGVLCALLFFAGPAAAETRCSDGVEWTDPVVAEATGMTVERLASLRAARSLNNDDVCTMPKARLERALFRLDNPMPDQPGQWAKFRARQQADERGVVAPNGLVRALEKRRSIVRETQIRRAARGQAAGLGDPLQWTSIGPTKVGGRVRSLLVHPTNPSRMWTGSVAGGLWTTADGGASWTPVNDFMANLSIATLAMSPTDPNRLYAGTGEGYFNLDAVRGAGIFASSDGGVTWAQMPSTNPTLNADWYYVNRIAIAPDNAQVMLAATNGGLYRTADGGATWTLVLSGDIGDVKFHPANGNLAVLGGRTAEAWYSTNGGQTWSRSDLPPYGRTEIAWSRSSPNVLYASVDLYAGSVYRSINGGVNWTLAGNAEYLGNQGWYNNTIWVDPTNANHVIVGGIDLYRSVNGGTTFTKISSWFKTNSVHADHHAIVAHPGFNGTTNRTVFFGNDGGVYAAYDVNAVAEQSGWTNLNNGLAITQFYGGAGHAGKNGRIYGGTQDNGSLVYRPGADWVMAYGGDGGASAVDPTDGNYLYGETPFLTLHRSTDGGATVNYIFDGILDAGNDFLTNFIAPFKLDPNNPNTLYAGGRRLWRSTNAKASIPTWTSIFTEQVSLSQIHVAEGNPNVVWVGTSDGWLHKSTDATLAAPSFTNVLSPVGNRMVLALLVDKDNVNRVYVGFGGYAQDNLWRSDNGGATWTNIGAGLPASPVRSILRHPYNANWLYVGTEVGVFTSENGGTTWSATNEGPANVSTDQLFWYDVKTPTLVAVTHGRGMFLAALAGTRLTVSKAGSGGGTVSSDPPGLGCGATCTALFANSSPVTLTAEASSTSRFAGWSGACSGTAPTCTVTLAGTTAVTASFELTHAMLVVTRSGAGTVSSSPAGIDCGGACSQTVPLGTTVTLTATPADGSVFTGWSGACSGTAPTCTVTVAAAVSVGATFAPSSLPVTVTTSGAGRGTVASEPAGIACGGDCSESFPPGAGVTLRATAATGAIFARWTGDCSGTIPTCAVAVNRALAINAEFAILKTKRLTVTRKGSGTITSSPAGITCGTTCKASFPVGRSVVLRARTSGSRFGGWSGSCSGTSSRCKVDMTRDRKVTATFTKRR